MVHGAPSWVKHIQKTRIFLILKFLLRLRRHIMRLLYDSSATLVSSLCFYCAFSCLLLAISPARFGSSYRALHPRTSLSDSPRITLSLDTCSGQHSRTSLTRELFKIPPKTWTTPPLLIRKTPAQLPATRFCKILIISRSVPTPFSLPWNRFLVSPPHY